MLFGLIIGLAIAVTAATFVTGFYLAVFGLPFAILLGERIRHPLALGFSLLDASVGAVVAVTGGRLGILTSEGDGLPIGLLLIVLCFALPAGYLYRRNVIAMRDTNAAFD